MSGGGGKGGSKTETQKVELPAWVDQAGQENVRLAREISKIGPIMAPEELPTTAALTPYQLAAMQNTGQAASAFGTAGAGMTGMEGMPTPVQFAGGVTGYTSAPITQAALQGWQQDAPAQYDFVRSFWNDPVTGGAARNVNSGAVPQYASAAPATARPTPGTLTWREEYHGLTPEMKARGLTLSDMMG